MSVVLVSCWDLVKLGTDKTFPQSHPLAGGLHWIKSSPQDSVGGVDWNGLECQAKIFTVIPECLS